MLDCPKCHRPAMSQRDKARLGPIRTVLCRSCGEPLTVPPAARLASTPFIISIVLAGLVAPYGFVFSALSLVAGATAMFAIHAFLVPLILRDP